MSGGDVAMASASASASGASEEASGTTMGQFGTVFGEEVLGAISQEVRKKFRRWGVAVNFYFIFGFFLRHRREKSSRRSGRPL